MAKSTSMLISRMQIAQNSLNLELVVKLFRSLLENVKETNDEMYQLKGFTSDFF